MRHGSLYGFLCALAVLGVACGCGKTDASGRRAVSGVVTIQGEPVAQGSIRFEPHGAGGADNGAAIHDGQYSIPASSGLLPGKYRVRIFAPKPAAAADAAGPPDEKTSAPAELVPEEYNVKSDKLIEVAPQGPATFDFAIPAKRR